MALNDITPFALLLVDAQKDFWPEKLAELYPDFPENVSNLLSLCREEGLEVIHIRASFKEDMSDWMPRYRIRKRIPCVEGTEGSESLSFANELPGEKVISKQSFDGFHTPDLLSYLEEQNKKFLLVAGLVTSTCVLFTASSATQLGYLSAVVSDCCADEPTLHDIILQRYQFIFDLIGYQEIPEFIPRWNETLAELGLM